MQAHPLVRQSLSTVNLTQAQRLPACINAAAERIEHVRNPARRPALRTQSRRASNAATAPRRSTRPVATIETIVAVKLRSNAFAGMSSRTSFPPAMRCDLVSRIFHKSMNLQVVHNAASRPRSLARTRMQHRAGEGRAA
jgi:hypothetical protein